MKEVRELQQKCLGHINSGGLTKDLEASYIQAYALLLIAEKLDELAERQEKEAKHAEDAKTKKGKS